MKWLKKIFAPKPQRVGLKLVSYSDANAYLEVGWQIAPEEDRNRCLGFVWLERLVVSKE